MGLSVFYPADIRNALLAAEQAMSAATQIAGKKDDLFVACYIAGYLAALTTLALAFGLVGTDRQSEADTWRGR